MTKKVQKHWVYRFNGDYAGLVEDMNRITQHDPDVEIINVQRLEQAAGAPHEYLIYTRRMVLL